MLQIDKIMSLLASIDLFRDHARMYVPFHEINCFKKRIMYNRKPETGFDITRQINYDKEFHWDS